MPIEQGSKEGWLSTRRVCGRVPTMIKTPMDTGSNVVVTDSTSPLYRQFGTVVDVRDAHPGVLIVLGVE